MNAPDLSSLVKIVIKEDPNKIQGYEFLAKIND
jgi:hypothetical protein